MTRVDCWLPYIIHQISKCRGIISEVGCSDKDLTRVSISISLKSQNSKSLFQILWNNNNVKRLNLFTPRLEVGIKKRSVHGNSAPTKYERPVIFCCFCADPRSYIHVQNMAVWKFECKRSLYPQDFTSIWAPWISQSCSGCVDS